MHCCGVHVVCVVGQDKKRCREDVVGVGVFLEIDLFTLQYITLHIISRWRVINKGRCAGAPTTLAAAGDGGSVVDARSGERRAVPLRALVRAANGAVCDGVTAMRLSVIDPNGTA